MIYPHFPIAYQSEQTIKAAKETAVNLRREMTTGLQVSCAGCDFVNLCVTPLPCKAFPFCPYSALHILRAFALFEIPVKSCTANVRRRQLQFQLENGKLLSVAVSVFCSPEESKVLLFQVLLRRFPEGFFFGNHRIRKLHRWKTLTDSSNGNCPLFVLQNENPTELQTRNETFHTEIAPNFCNGNRWAPNTPERGQNTPKMGHKYYK